MRSLDFRYITLVPYRPANQITNSLANGKAARWQGYAARDGLGRTRTRNHVSDASPTTGVSALNQLRLLSASRIHKPPSPSVFIIRLTVQSEPFLSYSPSRANGTTPAPPRQLPRFRSEERRVGKESRS